MNEIDYISQKLIQIFLGKETGFVTTTRVTHPTPASLYGHSANRKWECDNSFAKYKQDGKGCKDMGRQLIEDEPGRNIKVKLF